MVGMASPAFGQGATPPAAAPAKELTSAGSVVLGAERLFGLFLYQGVSSYENYDFTENGVLFNLLYSANAGHFDPYAFPRAGFDVFATDHFSVGLAAGYSLSAGEYEATHGDLSSDHNLTTYHFVSLTPRAGGALMFNDVVGFWGRGGLAYSAVVMVPDSGSSTTVHLLAVNLEALLLLCPAAHFTITLGPVADIGFFGKSTHEEDEPGSLYDDVALRITNLGLVVGLGGWL
jgi:hypothetical protein